MNPRWYICLGYRVIFAKETKQTRVYYFVTESYIAEAGRQLGDHLVQRPAQSRVSESRLPRDIFSMSMDGDSTTCLGNLFKWNFLYFKLYPLPLLLSLGTRVWLCHLYSPTIPNQSDIFAVG